MSHPARVAWPVLCALFEIGALPAWAQVAPAVAPVRQVTPELVRSKDAMLGRLLSDSPVAQRIAQSRNGEAQALFAQARQQYGAAAAAFAAGDLARADEGYNDALWSVGKARQLVPDDESRKAAQNLRYARLLASTDTLLASYARHSDSARGEAIERERTQIEHVIAEAKGRANTEQLAEAIRALESAERMLMAAINRLLGSATLDYAERFATPAQEFAHELARNQGFVDLVPLALDELRPGDDARRLVERYVAQNQGLRDQAQAQAGDHASALKTIRSATGFLQRALAAAGLIVPQADAAAE